MFHIRDVISPDRNGISRFLENKVLAVDFLNREFSVEQEIAPEKASGKIQILLFLQRYIAIH